MGTWRRDGFCVSNPTTPYWTSHDLCLYADTIGTAICGLIYFLLHKEEGMKAANDLVFFNLLGILAHGFGHGGIGARMRDENFSQRHEGDLSYFSTIHTK